MRPTSKWHFVSRLPSGSFEIPKVGTPTTLGGHNFMCRPLIEMRTKQNYILCQDISNGMWHATCMQGNWGDSRLLVVGSLIANLTPGPSFGHNLCFKCPNGSCKLISDIYVPRAFQWYKELFNPLGFDPCNYLPQIRKSIGTPTPKMGVHLGVWGFIPSHSFALLGAWDVTPMLPSWPTTLQALALVASWRLRLQQPLCDEN
jgi:hypothetical protein